MSSDQTTQKTVIQLINQLNNADEEERKNAVNEIGDAPTEVSQKLLMKLLRMLKHDNHEIVRSNIAWAVGQIGKKSTDKKEIALISKALLCAMSKDPEWIVRGESARSLGAIGSTTSVHSLKKAMAKTTNAPIHDDLQWALSEIEYKDSWELIKTIVQIFEISQKPK
jgi:HEAT repeat protein